MATEQDYIVLPVSALKDQVTTVFDALKADKVVYVSNRGRIAAAFRPYTFVPEGVAALHVNPNLNLPFTVSARDMGRGVPSKQVSEAAAGLPSIVEKDRNIYGMLTPASAPRPRTIPDPNEVGAKAEAILAYQQRNPSSPIEDVLAFADEGAVPHKEALGAPSWPLGDPESGIAQLESDDAVDNDLDDWRKQGSDVEDIVKNVFAHLLGTVAAIAHGTPTPVPNLGIDSARLVAPSARIKVLSGERQEAAGDTVVARTDYVTALVTEGHPNVGVMWRLGNLARTEGHTAEAARWFRLSLACDAVAETAELVNQDACQSGYFH